MRHRLYIHLVWTTRERLPLITHDVAEFLAINLPVIARQERGRLLEMGLVQTHIHTIVRIHPLTSITRLVQRFKGGTSTLLNRRTATTKLKWAKGYNVDTVGMQALHAARA